MSELIRKQNAINIVVFECGKWTGLAKEICKQIKQLPSAQPDFDITVKIDKAYDDGYEAGGFGSRKSHMKHLTQLQGIWL